MEIRTLYRYERETGKVTVSTVKPDCDYAEMYRIVADNNKVVTLDNENFYSVIDTEIKDGWIETIDPEELNRQYTETDTPIEETEQIEE